MLETMKLYEIYSYVSMTSSLAISLLPCLLNTWCDWWNIISTYGLLLLANSNSYSHFSLRYKLQLTKHSTFQAQSKQKPSKPCYGLVCCRSQASFLKRFSLFFKCWDQMFADLSKYQMLISLLLSLLRYDSLDRRRM